VTEGADETAGADVTDGAEGAELAPADAEALRATEGGADVGDVPPQATAREITRAAKPPIPKRCFKSGVLAWRRMAVAATALRDTGIDLEPYTAARRNPAAIHPSRVEFRREITE
jgi:hypothetical protein